MEDAVAIEKGIEIEEIKSVDVEHDASIERCLDTENGVKLKESNMGLIGRKGDMSMPLESAQIVTSYETLIMKTS